MARGLIIVRHMVPWTLTLDDSRRNYLLAGLDPIEFERIRPGLELTSLELGKVLREPGEKLKYAYFPTTAVVSLLYLTEDGKNTEIGMVGNDGMLGIELCMGDDLTTSRAVVQIAGEAFRLSTTMLKAAFAERKHFHDLLLRYANSLMMQIAQTAACNRYHRIQKQVARWLLQTQDYTDLQNMTITQDWISQMLGVRRETVTTAISKLTDMGLINHVRGNVTILDRPGLEHATCECYDMISDEHNRLLSEELSHTF